MKRKVVGKGGANKSWKRLGGKREKFVVKGAN